MRRGFTLLEVLVAAVLMGLLATLLTSMLNQGSIAWANGETAVADAAERRQAMADTARAASATLVGADTTDSAANYRVLSAWDESGAVRTGRPLVRVGLPLPADGTAYAPVAPAAATSRADETITVVVSSAGPDGKWGTADDLTTAPEEAFE